MSASKSTLIENKLNYSASINGIIVPPNSYGKALCNFVDPAIFHNPGFEEFQISIRGSLTRCKNRGKYFALTTAHQCDSFGFEQLCIQNHLSRNIVTSNKCIFAEGGKDAESTLDIRLFEFTDAVVSGALPKSGWFDISEWNPRYTNTDLEILISIGYPSEKNFVDYGKSKYEAQPQQVLGSLVRSEITGRNSFEPEGEKISNPDGFSGAPVFGVFLAEKTPKIFLIGILTNASKSRFNFTPMGKIGRMVEKLLN